MKSDLSAIRRQGIAPFSGVGQPLMGDRRALAAYEGIDHVPYPLKAKLTRAECEPYFAYDGEPVTFTAKVPLERVSCGREAILDFIYETWFEFPVYIYSAEFRAVGASFDTFSEEFCGDVHIQVTGAISPQ